MDPAKGAHNASASGRATSLPAEPVLRTPFRGPRTTPSRTRETPPNPGPVHMVAQSFFTLYKAGELFYHRPQGKVSPGPKASQKDDAP